MNIIGIDRRNGGPCYIIQVGAVPWLGLDIIGCDRDKRNVNAVCQSEKIADCNRNHIRRIIIAVFNKGLIDVDRSGSGISSRYYAVCPY